MSVDEKTRFHALCVVHDTEQTFVVSEDIDILLKKWAEKNNFRIPEKEFFLELRKEMKQKLLEFFPDVHFIAEEEISAYIRKSTFGKESHVVSLDKVYTSDGFLALEATRMVGENFKDLDNASRSHVSIEEQIETIALHVQQPVILIDDVIYSGNNLVDIIQRMKRAGIEVSSVITGISIGMGAEKILSEFNHVSIYSTIHYEKVIDEVCERDFYVGVPFSGRLLGTVVNGVPIPNDPETGVPYFRPFANIEKTISWGSIPEERVANWSRFCISQSIKLWEKIESLSGKKVPCSNVERIPISFSKDGSSFVEKLRECLHLV